MIQLLTGIRHMNRINKRCTKENRCRRKHWNRNGSHNKKRRMTKDKGIHLRSVGCSADGAHDARAGMLTAIQRDRLFRSPAANTESAAASALCYTAPGTSADRAANGKASVARNHDMCIGGLRRGSSWLLVRYDHVGIK